MCVCVTACTDETRATPTATHQEGASPGERTGTPAVEGSNAASSCRSSSSASRASASALRRTPRRTGGGARRWAADASAPRAGAVGAPSGRAPAAARVPGDAGRGGEDKPYEVKVPRSVAVTQAAWQPRSLAAATREHSLPCTQRNATSNAKRRVRALGCWHGEL